MPGEVRKDLADRQAALSVSLELERGRQGDPGSPLGTEVLVWQFFAGVSIEFRLGIEGIDLRHPAVQEDVDDVSGASGEMRRRGHR